jgi:hypothetical protein
MTWNGINEERDEMSFISRLKHLAITFFKQLIASELNQAIEANNG